MSHFNIFQAYAQGGFESIDREKTLEDNVTRALMVTLRSVPAASKHLLNSLFELKFSDELSFNLQTGLKTTSNEARSDKKWRKELVLGIVPQKEKLSIPNIPEYLLQQVSQIQSEVAQKTKFQKALNDRVSGLQKGEESKTEKIHEFLRVERKILDNLDISALRYLYELTLGSRPDATILDNTNHTAILIEVKINGPLVDAQIRRHISNNFNNNKQPKYVIYGKPKPEISKSEVPVYICSWRDISSILTEFQKTPECQSESKAKFLIEQLIEYLEENGMGELKFKQADFLGWDEKRPMLRQKISSLTEVLIDTLADIFNDSLGKPQSKVQYAGSDYIGSNLWYTSHKDAYPVPHWSLGLMCSERRIRLFIQCEGSKLSKKIADMDSDTQKRLVKALYKLRGDPHFQMRVEEKWFVMQAGQDERKSIYPISFAHSLGDCRDEDALRILLDNALQAIRRINNRSSRARIKDIPYLNRYQGRTIVGVLQLDFSLNWFELENIGLKVESKLIEAARKMADYYEVLLSEFAK